MRRIVHIAFTIVLGLLVVQGCSKKSPDGGGGTVLNINVRIPGEILSRAEVGTLPSTQAEKVVHRLQVWVFRHSDASLIAYLDPDVNNLHSGTAQKFSVFIEEAFAREMPRVDVYALANGDFLSFDRESTRANLEAAVLSGGVFGVDDPVSDVPAEGLPFSGVMKDVAMSGNYPVLEIETLTIVRAVSKVRVLLCRQNSDLADGFVLESLHLGGSIGASERVFTNSGYAGSSSPTNLFDIADGTYSLLSHTFALPSSIPVHDDPASFSFRCSGHAGETPAEYERRVDVAVEDGRLCQAGLLYLRETDKKLSGTVSYKADALSATKTQTFEMASEGDFTRNHCWVVYAYFLGGKLYVKPVLVPWTAGHDRHSHITQGSVEMSYSNYLRYDEDQSASTWGDSYVAVAYGSTGGAPRFSPMITVKTNNTNDLRLQVNNEEFRFVKKTSSGYAFSDQLILIDGSAEEQITEFFLVPSSSDTPMDPVAEVMLIEIAGGGIPPRGVPFNPSLPGSEDHTVIRFYNIGSATYSANQYNARQSGDMQSSSYWIEEFGKS